LCQDALVLISSRAGNATRLETSQGWAFGFQTWNLIPKEKTVTNPKGDLIDYCRVQGLGAPVFESHQEGPEHQPTFSCDVLIQEQVYASGQGRTKRDAEKAAANLALVALRANPPEAEHVPHVTAGKVAHTDDEDEGPWPIFPEVLGKCLEVANSRVATGVMGIKAIEEIRELTLELYQGLLEELGEYS
jgi:ribonuclease III